MQVALLRDPVRDPASRVATSVAGCFLLTVGAVSGYAREWNPRQYERIDVHTHYFAHQPYLIDALDSLNVRWVLTYPYDGMDKPEVRREEERQVDDIVRRHPHRLLKGVIFDLSRFDEPEYIPEVLADLEAKLRNGMVCIKVWKVLGMTLRDNTGALVPVDTPRLDPVWRWIADHNVPVIMHISENIDYWLPLRPGNRRYRGLLASPRFHMFGKSNVFARAEIFAQRNRLIARHPDLTFIGNHMGCQEQNLDDLDRALFDHPNFYVETGGRCYHLADQPADRVRAFFIKHQDRILFGTDAKTRAPTVTDPAAIKSGRSGLLDRYRDDFRYLETTEEVTVRGVTGRGLGLPPAVLRKIYRSNARRLIPETE